MGTRYYVLARVGDKQYVAISVGKYIDPYDVNSWFRHPSLLGIIIWCGRRPKIVSEYALEDMLYQDNEIIYLEPENIIEYEEGW